MGRQRSGGNGGAISAPPMSIPAPASAPAPHVCEVCQESFPSKTRLFKHLIVHGVESNSVKPTKVVLLVGWLAAPPTQDSEQFISDQAWNCLLGDATSYRNERALFRALHAIEHKLQSVDDIEPGREVDRPKGFSRAASCMQRTSALFGTEPTCHGLCDTYCFLIRPLGATKIDDWVAQVNSHLPPSVRVLHGYELSSESASSFQAETECSQRRYEYLIPLRVVMPSDLVTAPTEPIVRKSKFRAQQAANLHLEENSKLMDIKFPVDTEEGQKRIAFFRKLKELGKEFGGRHRFHNYTTAGACPNDTTTMRRLDRIYHKNLVVVGAEPWVVLSVSGDTLMRGQVRKILGMQLAVALGFLPLSYLQATLSSDAIMEVPHLPGWGLYLAECRYANWEANFRDSRLDPRRSAGNDAGIESPEMVTWLSTLHDHIAQHTDEVFPANWVQGFRTQCQDILHRHEALTSMQARTPVQLKSAFVAKFGQSDCSEVAQLCSSEALPESPTVEAAGEETEGAACVSPKASTTGRTNAADFKLMQANLSFVRVLPEFDDCPSVYKEVLRLLRAADRSQAWPASSTGRQSVIASTSLLEAGGRGGSFSVGALPKHLVQPRGNDLFPELMRACFRLERALCPDRPPSATIAINRHAQFLPHRDSGAGMGQSVSLIVALGAFVGGEIVVDQQVRDLRYQPVEFNGWKSIHYTLPFVGERYSLVWFTPLGLSQEDLWWWNESDMATT